jgi:hypothetical protein
VRMLEKQLQHATRDPHGSAIPGALGMAQVPYPGEPEEE